MKKNILLSVFLAFALFCGAQTPCWDGTVATSYDGGDGTPENPYQIATPEQLALLAQQTNNGTGGDACYILTEDICLSGDSLWMPIGGNDTNFTGVFDGDNKTITGMNISNLNYGGLFGYTNGANIKNVIIHEAQINVCKFAGMVVGMAIDTKISDCTVDGMLDSYNGASYVGGIVGKVMINNDEYIIIKNCINNAVVKGTEAGGIVGIVEINDGSILFDNCVNNNEIYGKIFAAGIVGDGSSTIKNCSNYASINASISAAGGIVGQNHSGDIINCYNYGAVIGRSAGGIVANAQQSMISCCGNLGDIIGTFKNNAHIFVGGITASEGVISDCFNRGNLAAIPDGNAVPNDVYIGGITASSTSNIHNCYNTGSIDHSYYPNGCYGIIVGPAQDDEQISNCYWHGDYDISPSGINTLMLQGSCAFNEGNTNTSWILEEPQYGTTDLLDALNVGSDNGHYWIEDTEFINGGFPMPAVNEQTYPLFGDEWYYEITSALGQITYQHLDYLCDTTISHKKIKVIVKTNTLYDKDTEVSHEYIYDENDKVYWWNKSQQNFTILYDFAAEIGDEWQIEVGENSITIHVDDVGTVDYNGQLFRALTVSDTDDIFSGTIVCGIGHLTSFFPEKLLENKGNFDVDGIRCYWDEGALIYHEGNLDCDEIYSQWHLGVDEIVTDNGLNVYPNPTNGIIYVLSDNYGEYRITNLMGQTMIIGTIDCENQQIDISSLSEGIYFITIDNATMKFMKM